MKGQYISLEKSTRLGSNEMWRKSLATTINLIRQNPNDDAPGITVYHPTDKKDENPTIIIVPGGGYYSREKIKEGTLVADYFVKKGFVAIVLHYRVFPYVLPAAIVDGITAVNYIRKHAQELSIDTNRIGMMGFSAGGHLVSAIAAGIEINNIKAKIDFQILCYPLIDISRNSIRMNFLRKLINKNIFNDGLDTSSLVHDGLPPTYIWHARNDKIVPVWHAEKYIQSLEENKISYQCRIYPKGKHGFGLVENANHKNEIYAWHKECMKWLEEIL